MSTMGPLLQRSRVGVQSGGTRLVRNANQKGADWCIVPRRGHDDRVRTAGGEGSSSGETDLERSDQLRSGDHPGRAVQRDRGPHDQLPAVRAGDVGPDPVQAGQRADRQGGGVLRHREGRRPRRRRVRDHRAGRAGRHRARPVADDRHQLVRRARRHRPGPFPEDLLAGPGQGGVRQVLLAAAPGHGEVQPGRHRDVRDARQGVPDRGAGRRRDAGAEHAAVPRGHPRPRQGAQVAAGGHAPRAARRSRWRRA